MIGEAKIVLPTVNKEGKKNYAELHRDIIGLLINTWGGFTSQEGTGVWKDSNGVLHEDTNMIYTIAMVASKSNEFKLQKIAEDALALSDELCIYIVQANGNVEFIERD